MCLLAIKKTWNMLIYAVELDNLKITTKKIQKNMEIKPDVIFMQTTKNTHYLSRFIVNISTKLISHIEIHAIG